MVINHDCYHPLYTDRDHFIILVTGGRGCERPDQEVIMADMSVKQLKDVRVGDKLMGDDFTPRIVLQTLSGRSEMYHVRQSNAEDYWINGQHILTLADYRDNSGKLIDVPLSYYFTFSLSERERLFGVRKNYKNKTFYSLIEIEHAGEGDWCGVILDGNHRYLHADGTVTHNSGKSYGCATFIERLTFEMKRRGVGATQADKIVHNILYSRYTMVSAAMSVIPEFMEKVEADGTGKYFHTTRTDVVNMMTGSKIMFRGLRTSSGNQTARLKSIHGITTFVCDEAEEWTSEREFDTIAYSIRQPGIQNRIIIMMNPTDSNHFIYQRYIKDTHEIQYFDGVPVQISTHPQVLHIHTTYLDNIDNLSQEFIDSARAMKEKNPERYAHVFMGQWADVAEGAVFKGWGVCDEFPQNAKKVAAGLDLGYTNDVSACVRCGVVGNDLYLDEVFYRTHMGVRELIDELKRLGLFVYSDSADPRLIDEISHGGVVIYPVAKPAGSIVAGIEKMKDFDNIFVTKRSHNLQDELRNYVWAKDKDGNYINYPEDHDNHAIDASRYFVNGCLLGKVLQPKRIDRSQINIF